MYHYSPDGNVYCVDQNFTTVQYGGASDAFGIFLRNTAIPADRQNGLFNEADAMPHFPLRGYFLSSARLPSSLLFADLLLESAHQCDDFHSLHEISDPAFQRFF
jgi:hypothetical protein